MSECNPVKTPGEIQKKTNYLINKEEIDNRFYREVIGALMYLVVGTRPDIANTVSRLAQFVNEPCQQDWLAVKRILRYLADEWESQAGRGASKKKNRKSIPGGIEIKNGAEWERDRPELEFTRLRPESKSTRLRPESESTRLRPKSESTRLRPESESTRLRPNSESKAGARVRQID
ncbi:Retrovirus-related Pol polyprotein from transposon RE1; Endonuclease RE1 [Eumeta japonica]|uniref:Retrovirus-related Pol polyprotein from transposon RE1 Endonuclease RE1 n=1 Tax=Eumeta variegata TaxID=151549 RepID=A0A4C1Z3I5_EUMVA|nr:Retrovirus-related Pol polyprotein from transposon RE1; Endonuclease RE1 [Eumeta japonica]